MDKERGSIWELFKANVFYFLSLFIILALAHYGPRMISFLILFTGKRWLSGVEEIMWVISVVNFLSILIMLVVIVLILRSVIEKILEPELEWGQASMYNTPIDVIFKIIVRVLVASWAIRIIYAVISAIFLLKVDTSVGPLVIVTITSIITGLYVIITITIQYIQALQPGLYALDTFKTAISIVIINLVPMLINYAVALLILVVGALTFGVGLIVAIPIAVIYMTKNMIAYCAKAGITYQEYDFLEMGYESY